MWKNIGYNFIKTVSSVVLPLLIFVYVSRIIGPEGIGKYNFSSTYVSYFTLAASLGITTYAVRECASVKNEQEKVNRVSSEILSINICTMVVSYLALAITLFVFNSLSNYLVLICILSGNIFFTIIGADWINSAYEDFRYITIRTLLFQIIAIVLIFLFVKKPDDCYIYALITVGASAGANICNVFYRRRFCRARFTIKMNWKIHFPPIILLFVMLLVQTIFSNTDITIIGIFRNDIEVGLYSTAVKIFSILTTLVASIMWVVLPRLTVYFKNSQYSDINNVLKDVFQLMFGFGLPCIVGTALLSKEIILIVGGQKYAGAEIYLVLLMIALFFSLIGGSIIGNMILLPSKQEKHFLIACIVAAVANISLNLAFVPRFGALAAAISTIISHIIIFIMLIPRIDKKIDFSFIPKTLFPPIIGCFGIASIVFFTKKIFSNSFLVVLIAVLLSVFVYFFTLKCLKYELVEKAVNKLQKRSKSNE